MLGIETAIAVIGIAILGAVYLTYRRTEWSKTRRALRAAERCDIGEFPDGRIAKVVGTTGFWKDTLTAPLSGRPCVHWQLWMFVDFGDEQHHLSDSNSVDFTLEDATGRAIVSVRGARHAIKEDDSTETWQTDPPSRVRALLELHGMEAGVTCSGSYREGRIEVGETIAVYGFGRREPDPMGVTEVNSYRGGPPPRVRITGNDDHPVYITDELG